MPELVFGEPAPCFELPQLGGGRVAFTSSSPPELPSLRLLVFFKSSCPTCRWALPFLERMHRAAGDALAVLGVAEDTPEDARAFADAIGLTFPIAIEAPPWPVSAAYGLSTVPTSFLVDGRGTILATSVGFSRDELLDIARRAAETAGVAPVSPFPEAIEIPAFRPG